MDCLFDFLKKNYRRGELIFQKDLTLLKSDNLRQQRKTLSDKGLILRYKPGVFLLPRKDKEYRDILPSEDTYLYSAYISRRGHLFGYYDCKTQLAKDGLIPSGGKPQCFSSMASVRKEYKSLIVLPSKRDIYDSNAAILSLLELLSHFEEYLKPSPITMDYLKDRVKKASLARNDRNFYSSYFHSSLYKTIFDFSLYAYIH